VIIWARYKWVINIKNILKEMKILRGGFDSTGSGYGSVARSFESENEPSGHIKTEDNLQRPSDY
jgi:hypothetical protein